MASSAALETRVQPVAVEDEDEDDFLAQHGDIIDQMVEQHTKERQTQERSATQPAPAPAPASRSSFTASVSGRGVAGGLAPAASNEGLARDRQPLVSPSNPFHANTNTNNVHNNNNNNNNVFTAPLPDPHDYELALSQQALKAKLAEKEGMVSILREKLGKRDMENFQLKRKLQEVTHYPGSGGGGGGGSFGQGLVQKSFALHNEQKIRQLTEELAFKEEEISEARRLKLQREEKLHFEQEEKQRLLAEVKELRARNETAEAEIMLRRQGGSALGNGLAEIQNKTRKNAASPTKRPTGTGSTDYYEDLPLPSSSRGKGGYQERFGAMGIDPLQQQQLMMIQTSSSDPRTDILSESSDLIVAITSHLHSKDTLEVETAEQLRVNLSSGGSLSAITQVLIQFIVNRVDQAKKHPVEYRKLYRLGNGKSCLDSVVHLTHKILYLDYSSRKDAALLLAHGRGPDGITIETNRTGASGEGGAIFLESFVSLLSYCSWNEEVTAKVIEMISMIVSSFDYEERESFCCILDGIFANEALCQSSSKRLVQSLSTLVYHLLESQAIARRVMKKEGLQMAFVRFLERAIDFDTATTTRMATAGGETSLLSVEKEDCTFVINRQGFSICALMYRQALELLEGQKEDTGTGHVSLAPALINSLGKNVLSVMIFLNRLADGVELHGNASHSVPGGEEREEGGSHGGVGGGVHKLYDDILIAILEGLSLLQVLLCDMNTARMIWKATFRASGSIRQFHITMGMLLEGSLQLMDRSWPLMKYDHLQIPSLWPCHAHAHDLQQSETPIACITDLASWIYQTITTQMLQQNS